jgi:hypothetical protein
VGPFEPSVERSDRAPPHRIDRPGSRRLPRARAAGTGWQVPRAYTTQCGRSQLPCARGSVGATSPLLRYVVDGTPTEYQVEPRLGSATAA